MCYRTGLRGYKNKYFNELFYNHAANSFAEYLKYISVDVHLRSNTLERQLLIHLSENSWDKLYRS